MGTLGSYLAPNIGAILLVGLIAWVIVYPIALAVYRLFFSQLATFPGPKIAAATGWYEFYYDCLCEGKYVFEIEKMHQKYGPVVRINPYELSLHDPDAYNDIYVSESKRRTEHYDTFFQGIEFDGSHLLTVSHDLHRQRRRPLEPFFSPLGVSRLHQMLAEVVEKLAGRIEALTGTHFVIRLDHAFSAFSGDVIGRMCWEDEKESLDDPNFASESYNMFHMFVRSTPLFIGFPFLIKIVGWIPKSFVLWALPLSKGLNEYGKVAKSHVLKAKHKKLEQDRKGIHNDNTHVSLFDYILDSDMPESERSVDRLAKEAQVFLGAGTITTARTLTFISYYILANPAIHSRLREELKDTMAAYPQHVPSWVELEQLQYLQAIIKEGLRLSYGIMRRLPRISPDVPIQYRQWTIPIGVPVGMSAYLMHVDPVVYPKPFNFIPERWLGDVDPTMNRNFVPFCRGSRNCLGMNLAKAEINLALAVLYRPNGPTFELFETDESDIVQAHDFIVPLPKLSTKGVRILIR